MVKEPARKAGEAPKEAKKSPDSPSATGSHESESPTKTSRYSHRIILTSKFEGFGYRFGFVYGVLMLFILAYPGQVGIKPINLNWGDGDPQKRGPVVVSRHPGSIKVR